MSYKSYKVSDLCSVQTGPFGSQLHMSDYRENGTPIITVEHLGENRIINENTPFISDEDVVRLKKYTLLEGDIVFSRVGSVDRRAYVRASEENWLFSGRCMRLRVENKDIVNSLYLSYYFGLERVKQYIRGIAVGATMPSLNTKIMSDIEIDLPSVEIQRKVGKCLDELDQKIEINNRMNKNLEQMAQVIFKQWFIDFEFPNEQGKPYKSSGGKMVWCEELGKEIPEGWNTKRADEIYNINIGKTPPRNEAKWFEINNENVNWLSIADMGSNGVFTLITKESLTKSAIEKHNIKIVPKDTVVLSFKLTVGRVAITNQEILTNEAIAHFNTEKSYLREFTYLYLKNFSYGNLGSTSSIATAVNSKTIKGMPIICANEEIYKNFSITVKNIFEKIRINEVTNITLSNMRDTLLPKLMSGEIDVSNIEI